MYFKILIKMCVSSKFYSMKLCVSSKKIVVFTTIFIIPGAFIQEFALQSVLILSHSSLVRPLYIFLEYVFKAEIFLISIVSFLIFVFCTNFSNAILLLNFHLCIQNNVSFNPSSNDMVSGYILL